MNLNRTLYCFCENHCPGNKPNGTCFTVGDGRCFSQVEEISQNSDIIKVTKGCTPPETGSVFQCKAKKHHLRKSIECCDSNMCNLDLVPALPAPNKVPPTSSTSFDSPGSIFYLTAILCTVILSLTIIVAAVVTFYLSWRRSKSKKQVSLLGGLTGNSKLLDPTATVYNNLPSLSLNLDHKLLCNNSTARPEGAPGVSTLQALSDTSGSGKGVPLLIQMTISRQFSLVKQIGEGGFGSVWKATWYGDPIAVKIFSTREEQSWMREKEIYQTNLLRHDNILGFIAADIGGNGTWTQMLLVMEYHEHGSLFDFLQNKTLDVSLMLRLMHSILAGVNHLHNEIVGSEGKEQAASRGRSQRKPPIAHRDLKSKNILVKNNLTCCIADLGHCARYLWEENRIDVGHQTGLVGTKRYMPPEVVSDTLDRSRFEAYKACDMYNVSLILWEIARCCQNNNATVKSAPYSYPFQDVLPNDPSVEDVYQVVCVAKMRPAIPSAWSTDPVFRTVTRIITECWTEDWQARHSALRVKKSLASLVSQNSSSLALDLNLERKKAMTTTAANVSPNVNVDKSETNSAQQSNQHLYSETVA